MLWRKRGTAGCDNSPSPPPSIRYLHKRSLYACFHNTSLPLHRGSIQLHSLRILNYVFAGGFLFVCASRIWLWWFRFWRASVTDVHRIVTVKTKCRICIDDYYKVGIDSGSYFDILLLRLKISNSVESAMLLSAQIEENVLYFDSLLYLFPK